jgi:hypothetical protein
MIILFPALIFKKGVISHVSSLQKAFGYRAPLPLLYELLVQELRIARKVEI